MTINPFILHGEEVTPVRKLLYLKAFAGGAPLKEYEVTGNPAVFNTNVAKPLSGFTIPFLPVQQGTGEPSPDNVRPISGWQGFTAWRTGSNVFDEEFELGGINSSTGMEYSSTTAIRAKNYIPVVPGASYYLKAPTMTGFTGCWYDKNKNRISTRYAVNQVMTAPENAYFFRFGLPSSYGTTYGNDISINYPSTDTEYHAYTGASYPVIFPALGKNLFDKNNVDSGKQWWKGKKQAWDGGNASGLIPVVPGQAYTLSRTNPVQNQVMYFDESGAYIEQSLTWSNAQSTNTIPNGVYFVAFNVKDDSLDTAQFEKGSTASEYEPFTNTVYGGTLDAVTGVLSVTHKCVSLNDPDKWTKPSSNFIYDVYFNDRKQGYRENDVCSCFRTNSRSYPYLVWAGQSLNRYACYPGSTDLSIDDVKALAEANAIFCVYELAEPIEIQLDPLSIQTLIGDNTIWTDTNGENTVRYKKKG